MYGCYILSNLRKSHSVLSTASVADREEPQRHNPIPNTTKIRNSQQVSIGTLLLPGAMV